MDLIRNRYRGLRQPQGAAWGHALCGRIGPDMALVGVFTRRPPSSLTLQTPRRTLCIRWTPWTGWRRRRRLCFSVRRQAADLPSRAPGTPDAFTWWTASTPRETFPPTLPPWTPRPRAGGKTAIISAEVGPGPLSLVRALARRKSLRGELHSRAGGARAHSDAVRRIPRRPGRAAVHHPGPAALDAVPAAPIRR